jgi:hypothetical protein
MRIKLPLFLTAIFIFLFISIPRALAYIPRSGDNDSAQPQTSSPYAQQFTEGLRSNSWEKSSFDFTTVNNIMESISVSIIGTGEADIDQQLGPTALGTTTNLIAQLYQKAPASSVEYFADLGSRLKIVKPTYAQGIGFEGLSPIKGLWTKFRNVAYLIITLVLVFIGFAIMFRLKINPQTVVTIQSALPKIIIALILVTFSYAIAGLLIDFMYLIISFLSAIFAPKQELLYNANVFGFVEKFFGGFGFPTRAGAGETIGQAIKGLVSDLGWVLPGIGTLAKLIISVALLFSIFKLFFTLIIAYISIIAGVIFSPWLLMLEAIPGQKGLMNWLKMMLTNIVPFIITGVLFLMAGALLEPMREEGTTMWIAPFLGGQGSAGSYIPDLIAFGLILAAPTVITSVQKAIGTPGIAGMAAGVIAPITGAWESIRGAAVGAYRFGRQGYEMTPYAQRRQAYKKVKYERAAGERLDIEQQSDTSGTRRG